MFSCCKDINGRLACQTQLTQRLPNFASGKINLAQIHNKEKSTEQKTYL